MDEGGIGMMLLKYYIDNRPLFDIVKAFPFEVLTVYLNIATPKEANAVRIQIRKALKESSQEFVQSLNQVWLCKILRTRDPNYQKLKTRLETVWRRKKQQMKTWENNNGTKFEIRLNIFPSTKADWDKLLNDVCCLSSRGQEVTEEDVWEWAEDILKLSNPKCNNIRLKHRPYDPAARSNQTNRPTPFSQTSGLSNGRVPRPSQPSNLAPSIGLYPNSTPSSANSLYGNLLCTPGSSGIASLDSQRQSASTASPSSHYSISTSIGPSPLSLPISPPTVPIFPNGPNSFNPLDNFALFTGPNQIGPGYLGYGQYPNSQLIPFPSHQNLMGGSLNHLMGIQLANAPVARPFAFPVPPLYPAELAANPLLVNILLSNIDTYLANFHIQ